MVVLCKGLFPITQSDTHTQRPILCYERDLPGTPDKRGSIVTTPPPPGRGTTVFGVRERDRGEGPRRPVAREPYLSFTHVVEKKGVREGMVYVLRDTLLSLQRTRPKSLCS